MFQLVAFFMKIWNLYNIHNFVCFLNDELTNTSSLVGTSSLPAHTREQGSGNNNAIGTSSLFYTKGFVKQQQNVLNSFVYLFESCNNMTQ